MCSSKKIKYESNLQAEAYAKLFELKYNHPSRPYPCPECKHWHLTVKWVTKPNSLRTPEYKRRHKMRRRRKAQAPINNWENEGGALRYDQ